MQHNVAMKITAGVEYALQALLVIAAHAADGTKVTAQEIANSQQIPLKFLEKQLNLLRNAGFLVSERGSKGGYSLMRDPKNIFIADVIRVIEGPLAAVADKAPELAKYRNEAKHLTEVWIATRVALRNVFERISLQDILDGKYETGIIKLINTKDAWKRRST